MMKLPSPNNILKNAKIRFKYAFSSPENIVSSYFALQKGEQTPDTLYEIGMLEKIMQGRIDFIKSKNHDCVDKDGHQHEDLPFYQLENICPDSLAVSNVYQMEKALESRIQEN